MARRGQRVLNLSLIPSPTEQHPSPSLYPSSSPIFSVSLGSFHLVTPARLLPLASVWRCRRCRLRPLRRLLLLPAGPAPPPPRDTSSASASLWFSPAQIGSSPPTSRRLAASGLPSTWRRHRRRLLSRRRCAPNAFSSPQSPLLPPPLPISRGASSPPRPTRLPGWFPLGSPPLLCITSGLAFPLFPLFFYFSFGIINYLPLQKCGIQNLSLHV